MTASSQRRSAADDRIVPPAARKDGGAKTVLVYHDSANPWYAAQMLRGFTRFARTRRWRLVFVPRTDEALEPQRLRRLVEEFEPIGMFASYAEGLVKTAPKLLPSVWFDCTPLRTLPASASFVNADHVAIAGLAADEIRRLNPGECVCIAARGEPWSESRVKPFAERIAADGGRCRVSPSPFRPITSARRPAST